MAFQRRTGSIIAADVGNVTTRAILLDRVGGVYRFVARGQAPTTAEEPWRHVGEGLRAAIREIIAVTARLLLDDTEAETLIVPEGTDRSGVDHFVATASAGQPMRTILVGLVPDVSLESGRRAAEDTYLQIHDTFSLVDGRTREQHVDAIIAIDPDLIVIVGGTDGGATAAMTEQIRTVALGCRLIESANKPRILFAGNGDLHDEVARLLEEGADIDVIYAENVRPGLKFEQIDDAREQLTGLFEGFRVANTGGFSEISQWSEVGVLPTAQAFERIIRYMGGRADWDVLGVDLGSAITTVAAARGDTLNLQVCGDLGVGHGARTALAELDPHDLARWLRHDLTAADAVNYAWNKSLAPGSVPETPEELDMELALAREALRLALKRARPAWDGASSGLMPHFGEIVASGGVLGNAPFAGDSALVILDAIQPIGVTNLWLDAYGVAAALGAAAQLNAEIAVEALEMGGFVHLGTAICPTGVGRGSQVVLRAELTPESDDDPVNVEVRAGELITIPLRTGLKATLKLNPRGIDLGLSRRERTLEVEGGALGIIVDARGRPLPIPEEEEERRAAMRAWRDSLTREVAL